MYLLWSCAVCCVLCDLIGVICVWCSRPDTPGRESSVWHASTVLDVSSSSLSQQQLSGASPMSMMGSTESGSWNHNSSNAHSWGDMGVMGDIGGSSSWDGGGMHSGGNDWHAPPPQTSGHQPSSASSGNDGGGGGGGDDGAEGWDVDMIVIFRFGPDTGKYALIAKKPYMHASGNLMVGLRMRESSSSARRSDDNPVFEADCRDLRLGEPRKRDRVVVLYGAHKGVQGAVKAVLGGGEDVVLAELPMEMFKITQVAWLHTR